MNPRRRLGRLRAQAHDWIGANARARRQLDGGCAAILFYHRVLPHEAARRDAVEPGMYVTPDSFGSQLDWLQEFFSVLPLQEIAERVHDERPLPKRACAISFDDGWRDNLEHALPELKRRALPATLFVVTERVGTQGAFWPDEVSRRLAAAPEESARELRALLQLEAAGDLLETTLDHLKATPEADLDATLDRLREITPDPTPRDRELLDWDELAELDQSGIAIESHGATHAILSGMPEDEVASELQRSRDQLLERGHGRGALFAYPSGGWNPRVARLAGERGYRAAFTIDRGLAQLGSHPLAIPRLGIHDDISSTRAEFLYRVPGRR